jgi:hypothetical protein
VKQKVSEEVSDQRSDFEKRCSLASRRRCSPTIPPLDLASPDLMKAARLVTDARVPSRYTLSKFSWVESFFVALHGCLFLSCALLRLLSRLH